MTIQQQKIITLPVAKATVLRQRRFVKIGADAKVEEANSGEDAIGVVMENSTNQQDTDVGVAVPVGSVEEVWCGAAIDPATVKEITSDDEGRAVTAVAGNVVLGYALSETDGADQIVEVLFIRGAYRKA